jgi:4-hydroxy-3-polyprenylbenzoate decarboxylase
MPGGPAKAGTGAAPRIRLAAPALAGIIAAMPFKDLQAFLERLRAEGELKEIADEVSPDLEVAAITDRVVKKGGPALLFTNVRGSSMPLVINLFGSEKRMCLALETASFDTLAAEIGSYLEPEIPEGMLGKIQALPRLARLAALKAKIVTKAPCQEIVETDNPTLEGIPIIKCWPGDAGPYITFPIVITMHPELGKRNLGLYRVQKFDDKTLGMHWQLHKGAAEHYRAAEAAGKRLEVALCLGPEPSVIYGASAPLPPEIDELMLSGFIRKKSVEVTQCKTVDLEVPASSQIVLEGYCDPGERREEGPFGDHTGYYSLADQYPVFHLTAVTRRKDPIYHTIIVGPPPQEDGPMGRATVRLFLPMIRKVLPEVVDMNLPVEGIFHNLVLVSIKKRYPGHARKVAHALWGMGQMMFSKVIVIVDDDCDVQKPGEVVWRVGTHFDPRRDSWIVDGPMDVLEFATAEPAYGGKMGIDATRKTKEEGFPNEWPGILKHPEDVTRKAEEICAKLGI